MTIIRNSGEDIVQFTLRLPISLLDKIDYLASLNDGFTSRNQWIVHALANAIKYHESYSSDLDILEKIKYLVINHQDNKDQHER